MRFSNELPELKGVPVDLAWKLVDPFFRQTGSMVIGSLVFMVLSVIGFWGSGSAWYLCSFTYAAVVGVWRLGHHRAYLRTRETASPMTWAWRAVQGTWATGISWGAWGFVLFDQQKTFVMIAISTHAVCSRSGSLNNHTHISTLPDLWRHLPDYIRRVRCTERKCWADVDQIPLSANIGIASARS